MAVVSVDVLPRTRPRVHLLCVLFFKREVVSPGSSWEEERLRPHPALQSQNLPPHKPLRRLPGTLEPARFSSVILGGIVTVIHDRGGKEAVAHSPGEETGSRSHNLLTAGK